MNGEFTRIFGYTAQEAHGRLINDLMGKDVSARFKFIMERAGEVQDLDV